jgi:hypothetical protein
LSHLGRYCVIPALAQPKRPEPGIGQPFPVAMSCPGSFAVGVRADVRMGTMTHDLAAERTDYHGDHLLEDNAPASPYPLFQSWMEDAFAAKESGALPEPTAVVLSTTDMQGRPARGPCC